MKTLVIEIVVLGLTAAILIEASVDGISPFTCALWVAWGLLVGLKLGRRHEQDS